MVPQKPNSPNYKIDSIFFGKIGSKVNIQPYIDNKLRLVNDDRNVRFSLTHNIINSELIIEKGLNNKENSVSFRLGDRYLHTNNTCCIFILQKNQKMSVLKL